MTSTQRLADVYQIVTSVGDPRLHEWPLIATPWPCLSLMAMYLFIVKVGPKFMENRKAWDLRGVLVVYNFALVLLSAYMVYEFIASILSIPEFNLMCQDVSYEEDPRLMRLARVCYIYYLSKFVEYFDTFFFILRKKNNQISFLHVYHHASMCLLWWMVCKWIAGGVSYFGAACNSFIHVIMYLYYGLSAMGPSVQKYLWWKRYLTKMQLIQFLALIYMAVYALWHDGCGTHKFFQWVQFGYGMSLLVLFSNFYLHTYLKKPSKKE
ncbi:elongation of very long chain fatty acids protein 4 isoform X1 [Nematostella vectensis]|uniref:elongation of very long chain fatty acids protein 4 isoform X1 n=1 Tax=Nematostella vectensis TaxID=45351 RepID=UPI0020771AD4|nr:elongation of very long chain fatty acids protein 4 isoform X1 [Nematostella vectensis]XP_032221889.2 elongation of very long chain fatty acids protein 4 isoform X1 [Nematostella vectensis]